MELLVRRPEASQDLLGVDGETIIVRRGARRSGGSYLERARRIALWNTVMDEHNYAASCMDPLRLRRER